MKQTDKLGQIWYETSGENTKIGLTRSFLDTLDECWHILPPASRQIRMRAPLFTVETNDSLVSVLSPVAGNFLNWNERATNFPDKLRDTDVIIELTSKALPEPVVPPVDDTQHEWERQWGIENNGGMPMRNRLEAQQQRQRIERETGRVFLAPPPPPRDPARVTVSASHWDMPVTAGALRGSSTLTPRGFFDGAFVNTAVRQDPEHFDPDNN